MQVVFRRCVSILVLLDFPFGEAGMNNITEIEKLFQSLFYWIFLSEAISLDGISPAQIVSILVLLDFPFGAWKAKHSPDLPSCFNPCSIGFSFRRKLRHLISEAMNSFQSLFYWIFLSERKAKRFQGCFLHCFNPCSIGFSFRRYDARSTGDCTY